jgi:hypothetical protein
MGSPFKYLWKRTVALGRGPHPRMRNLPPREGPLVTTRWFAPRAPHHGEGRYRPTRGEPGTVAPVRGERLRRGGSLPIRERSHREPEGVLERDVPWFHRTGAGARDGEGGLGAAVSTVRAPPAGVRQRRIPRPSPRTDRALSALSVGSSTGRRGGDPALAQVLCGPLTSSPGSRGGMLAPIEDVEGEPARRRVLRRAPHADPRTRTVFASPRNHPDGHERHQAELPVPLTSSENPDADAKLIAPRDKERPRS